jgi:titin
MYSVTYFIRLKAYNDAGYSVSTRSTTGVVPYTIPGAPTIHSVLAGNTTITVNFTPSPEDVGTPITAFIFSTDGGLTYPYTCLSSVSMSTYTISNLVNGTAYTVAMKAVDLAGNSYMSNTFTPVIPFTVPDAPVITGASGENQAVQVFFAAPANNGSAITAYNYSFDNIVYTTASSLTSPITISGLTNGVPVVVYLKATNAAGNSLASSPSASVTPFTIPDAPQIDSLTTGNQLVNVFYTPPTFNGGSDITTYQYSLDQNPPRTYSPAIGLNNPGTITGITNGTLVYVTLLATNAAGDSAESNTLSIFTESVPDPPVFVSVIPGAKKITFTYVEPEYTGGSPILNYLYSVDGSNYVTMDVSSGGTYTIRDGDVDPYTNYTVSLILGNTYLVRLKTVNSMGDSLPVVSEGVVPCDIPSAPTIENLIVTPETLFLYFLPPSTNNGSVIQGYKYSLNGGPYIFSNLLNSPLIITEGIVNGTSYTVTLVATNAAGDSPPSNVSNIVKPTDNSIIQVLTQKDARDNTSNKTTYATLGDVIQSQVSSSGTSNAAVPMGAITSGQYASIKALLAMNTNI